MRAEVDAFQDAVRYFGRVLCQPAVKDEWEHPSVLSRMTVGALAGHGYLVARRVCKHLDRERLDTPNSVVTTPDAPTLHLADHVPKGRLATIRVDSEADLDAVVHVTVRKDAQRIAERGWKSVVGSFDAVVVATLTERLVDPPESIVPLGGTAPILFSRYLASRVAELLVHADDLALSVDLVPEQPAGTSSSIALAFLVEEARHQYGDLAVLRAFTRRERTATPIPSVY